MAKTKIKMKLKNFSSATPGPKPQAGERFPGGKLKPQKVAPNERVLAMRQATGLSDDDLRLGPIRYAYKRGWLEASDMVIAEVYADAYAKAGLGGPGVTARHEQESSAGAAAHLNVEWSELTEEQVRRLPWTAFGPKDLAAIWDSAFRPEATGALVSGALRRWKALALSMSPTQRVEVDRVVITGHWPTWLTKRLLEEAGAQHEGQRLLFLSGLKKMKQRMAALRLAAQSANDEHSNDNEHRTNGEAAADA